LALITCQSCSHYCIDRCMRGDQARQAEAEQRARLIELWRTAYARHAELEAGQRAEACFLELLDNGVLKHADLTGLPA